MNTAKKPAASRTAAIRTAAIRTAGELAEAIDRIGVTQDLFFFYTKDLREQITAKLADDGASSAAGEAYEASLTQTTESSISAKRFFNLMKAGKITEQQFLSAIRVGRSEALKFMPGEQLERLTTRATGSPKLTIRRQKFAEPRVSDGLRDLADRLEELGIG
jgi:hypothetical protein